MQQNLYINNVVVDSSKSDTYSRGSLYNDEINTISTGYFYLSANDQVKMRVTSARMDSSGTGTVAVTDAVINIARISGAAAASGSDGAQGAAGAAGAQGAQGASAASIPCDGSCTYTEGGPPSLYVGADSSVYLAEPHVWFRVECEETTYNIPGYNCTP
jgi:hypothetical protein